MTNADEKKAAPPSLAKAPFRDIYTSYIFSRVDISADLMISLKEYSDQIVASGGFRSSAESTYKALDANSDGALSNSEFKQGI